MKIYTYRSGHKTLKKVLSITLSLLVLLQASMFAAYPQVASAHTGGGEHTFSASVSPTTISLGASENFTFAITNTSALSATPASWEIKSFTIKVPVDFSVDTSTLSVASGWDVELDTASNEIRVSAIGASAQIDPGQSLSVSGNITSTGTSGGSTTWISRAFKNNSFTPAGGAEFHGNGSTDLIITVDEPTDLCPNIEGDQATVPDGKEIVDGNCVDVVVPTDVCPNIEGNQETMPEGMELVDGNCVQIPVDVCPNLEGTQTVVPEGYTQDESGNCNPPQTTDLCPNIEGDQATVPEGLIVDNSGNCVNPPVDMCPNIEGDQATVPDGKEIVDGNCVDVVVPTDVCPNIEGNQETMPEGMELVDGNCVNSETPSDLCSNIDGNQTEVPEGMEQSGDQCITPDTTTSGGGSSHHSRGGGIVLGINNDTPQGQVLGATFEPGLPNTGNGPINTASTNTAIVLFAGLMVLFGLNMASFKVIKALK